MQRLPGAPSRSAPAMAATGRPSVALAEGRATAATLRAAGMNVDLAPVVDVVRPESALHAEGRGFGFSGRGRGARSGRPSRAGCAPAAWPPRPSTSPASARRRPTPTSAPCASPSGCASCAPSTGRRSRRRSAPAPAWSCSRARSIPALSRAPAVLSARVVQGELREGLGFKGVTISDDLEAPAFASRGGASGAALAATRAGVDLLLFARTYDGADRAARALADGLRSGRVDRGARGLAGAACWPCARRCPRARSCDSRRTCTALAESADLQGDLCDPRCSRRASLQL